MVETPMGGCVLDLDARRILRALRHRVRYRYVKPRVLREEEGWRVVSPCCSRNIDAFGAEIDIALLRVEPPRWHLYARNHQQGCWIEVDHSDGIQELLDMLCLDPHRVFWP